jgi:hypothetical protein
VDGRCRVDSNSPSVDSNRGDDSRGLVAAGRASPLVRPVLVGQTTRAGETSSLRVGQPSLPRPVAGTF